MDVSQQDATFVIGLLGRIEDVNAEACALLGYRRDELLRLYGSELVPAHDKVRVGLSVGQMRRGEVEQRQGRLVRKDGRVIPVQV
jgi:PAS domain S-box-containing protein